MDIAHEASLGVRVVPMPFFDDYQRRESPVQWFDLCTVFSEDYAPGEYYAWRIGLDEPMRVGAGVIWCEYCVRRQIPEETPYRVRITDGRAVDLEQTPRASGLVPPELLPTHFHVYVWLTFERA